MQCFVVVDNFARNILVFAVVVERNLPDADEVGDCDREDMMMQCRCHTDHTVC